MGKRIIKTEERWDDLNADIVEDVQTVRFSLNDANYSIDLGPDNRDRLSTALEEFIANASAAGTRTASTPGRRARRSPEEVAASKQAAAERKAELDQVREWARANGLPVGDKGRVAQSLLDQYTRATR